MALAASHPHGLRFGAFSFRSHAEAFFHWAAPAADYRTLFETDGKMTGRCSRNWSGGSEMAAQRGRRGCGKTPSTPAWRVRRTGRRRRPRSAPRTVGAGAGAAPMGSSAFHAAVVAERRDRRTTGVVRGLPPHDQPVLPTAPRPRHQPRSSGSTSATPLPRRVDAVFGETWENGWPPSKPTWRRRMSGAGPVWMLRVNPDRAPATGGTRAGGPPRGGLGARTGRRPAGRRGQRRPLPPGPECAETMAGPAAGPAPRHSQRPPSSARPCDRPPVELPASVARWAGAPRPPVGLSRRDPAPLRRRAGHRTQHAA